jgi:CRISPR-associated protein Csd1
VIIQSLYQRYAHLAQDPSSGISPPHYSVARVSYVLVIDEQGKVCNVVDVREEKGRKKLPLQMVVPEQGGRQSNIKPFFLCDKAEYLLGYCADPSKESDAVRKFESSRELHVSFLRDSDSLEAKAIISFFSNWNREFFESDPLMRTLSANLAQSNDNVLVFQLKGTSILIHETEDIRNFWAKRNEVNIDSDVVLSQCLITGERQVPIARIHSNAIKGVIGSNTSGASIVSFNCESFVSYGKKQSYNAPVSQQAAFGYTTALNHMLASPKHTMRNIGEMTVVFWSDPVQSAVNVYEDFFKGFFVDEAVEKEDMGVTEQVKGTVDRIRKGMKLTPDMLDTQDVPFYVLGLSPNNARLSVRFYWQGEFGSMMDRIMEHVEEMAIEKPNYEHQSHPSLFHVLGETVRKGKDSKDKIPPSLAGDWFRAIIQGTMYPYSMFQAIIQRIRVDGNMNSTRVSVIKAYLMRYARIYRLPLLKEALTVSLNKDTTDTAYRLGRLFSVLERAQQDAAGGVGKLNATIKDRYFSSASATPSAVFPLLMRLAQHHMSKAEFGNFRDRDIQEILDGVEEFPKHMDLTQQGLFVLGYYHQKQYSFTKKTETKGEDKE